MLYARFFAGGVSFIWKTGAGLAFTVDDVAALGLYVLGVEYFGKTQGKIEKLGTEMGSAQGAPNPDQATEMNHLQSFLMNAYRFNFILAGDDGRRAFADRA